MVIIEEEKFYLKVLKENLKTEQAFIYNSKLTRQKKYQQNRQWR